MDEKAYKVIVTISYVNLIKFTNMENKQEKNKDSRF